MQGFVTEVLELETKKKLGEVNPSFVDEDAKKTGKELDELRNLRSGFNFLPTSLENIHALFLPINYYLFILK